MADDRTLPMTASPPADEDRAEPPVARRGRPVGDHEAKRTELLNAAISVIAHEGYAAASMRKVAQRAGYTTGALTYYFANKEEMVTAVAESLFDVFDTVLDVHERIDIRAGLERWLDWTNAKDPDMWLALFQLVAHAREEPAFADVFQRRYGRYRQRLAAIVAKGQDQGEIRSDIPADLLADQLCAIGDGWMIAFPIEPERFSPERIRALLDVTLTMIAPPSVAKPAS